MCSQGRFRVAGVAWEVGCPNEFRVQGLTAGSGALGGVDEGLRLGGHNMVSSAFT